MGFTIEADLNTEQSRKAWLEWKRRSDPQHYLDPEQRQSANHRILGELIAEGVIAPRHFWGTINCDGINASGEICGVTTTSGLAWKIPGRVGDSPILGAGPLRRRRSRRGGIHRARRGQPVRPLLVPDRRADAAGHAPEGRGARGAAAHPGEHRSRSGCASRTATRTSTSPSTR